MNTLNSLSNNSRALNKGRQFQKRIEVSMVRAKFRLNRVEITEGIKKRRTASGMAYEKTERGAEIYDRCELRTLIFSPEYANNDPQHENTKFWDASPSGEIKLGTMNPDAWYYFTLGKEYHIDFAEAD